MKDFAIRIQHARRRRTGPASAIQKIAPATDVAETVERIAPRRLMKPITGDVIVFRESASHHASFSMWRYRLAVDGEQPNRNRLFAQYGAAAAQGEELAARRRVRLFYAEDGGLSLLMDYRAPDQS